MESNGLKKSESSFRWLILASICLLTIGTYYTFDEPAALKSQIEDYMRDTGNFELQYSLLFSIYAFPNIILPFFGGFFVDKWGATYCAVIFAILIVAGNSVFAIGLGMKSWGLMYLGRFMHGCGGPNLCVAASTMLSQWFIGGELSLAFGLDLSLKRCASVLNNLVSPQVAKQSNVVMSAWIGVGMCVMSLLSLIPIVSIDSIINKQLQS